MATCERCGCKLPHTEGGRSTHIVKRASGYIAGWFHGEPPAGFVEECNANVPSDPAHVEVIPEWPADFEQLYTTEPPPGALHREIDAVIAGSPSYGPNADGNPYAQYTPEHRVWAKAQEHGKAAASWVIDGNTSAVSARGIVKGIEDGDPAVLDALPPAPKLDGEYKISDLLADAGYVPHDGTDLAFQLADQYLIEVEVAYMHEVERLARNAIPEPEAREGDE